MNLLKIQLPEKYQDIGLLLARIGFGATMLFGHGLGKVSRLLGPEEIRFADPYGLGPAFSLGLATFAEVVCSTLIMIGLFTRAALIPLAFTMFTVVFVVNFDKGFGEYEKAALFGIAYIALFFTGPGKYSIDARLNKQNP